MNSISGTVFTLACIAILGSCTATHDTQEPHVFPDSAHAVPAHRHQNPDGSQGGRVAETARASDSSIIGRNAQVSGSAQVHRQ